MSHMYFCINHCHEITYFKFKSYNYTLCSYISILCSCISALCSHIYIYYVVIYLYYVVDVMNCPVTHIVCYKKCIYLKE